MNLITLSSQFVSLELQADGERLNSTRIESCGTAWLDSRLPSGLFAVEVDGRRFSALDLQFTGSVVETAADGVRTATLHFAGPSLAITHTLKLYPDSALLESSLVVTNTGTAPLILRRIDSLVLDLAPADYRLLSFASDWGAEFEPRWDALAAGGERAEVLLETRWGRSSKGMHPWCAVFDGDGRALSCSVAWSGNWRMRFQPLAGGGWRLSAGLSDWNFFKELAPGESFAAPPVVVALGRDLDAVAQQYASVGRRFWYPHSPVSDALPVEWNHWWSYEDVDINEDAFRQNTTSAAALGFELVTLDAGWFGPSDESAHWGYYRGDWEKVNRRRFPSGLRLLSDDAHEHGLYFGLWCEIEALGKKTRLALERPDFLAQRDGEPLGYACLGNPAAQQWAFETLSGLIERYACDWIKLDFNVDPGAGCNRLDHGHGAGDGLYDHVMGYYALLDRLREAYPDVALEACSSGGLRIDLGLARRTHTVFLSDPDWPVHTLQVFWGASLMLAPERLLHWSYSQWRQPDPPPQQHFDPRDPALTPHQLDYYTRIAMLGQPGFSQKLPELPEWVKQRLALHAQMYKEMVRPFVQAGVLHRLTGQPQRDGSGERWCAFQYSLGDQHLIFVFRLPGGEQECRIYPVGLDPDVRYLVEDSDDNVKQKRKGSEILRNGLRLDDIEEEGSAIILLTTNFTHLPWRAVPGN